MLSLLAQLVCYMIPSIKDQVQPYERITSDPQLAISQESAAMECKIKQCNTEEPAEIIKLCDIGKCEKQDIPSSNCETNPENDDAKSEGQKVTDDYKNSKPATKYAPENSKIRCTVPQPFALATEKRALYGTRPYGTEFDNAAATNKPFNVNGLPNSSAIMRNVVQVVSPTVPRNPLQPDNKKHPDEDKCSVASSTVASTRKFKTTVALAPLFRSNACAEKRKEFYSKLEKHQALEAEKTHYEARTKLPPTRARSPKLGRRKSCSDAGDFENGIGAYGRRSHQSVTIYRNILPMSLTDRKIGINAQNGSVC